MAVAADAVMTGGNSSDGDCLQLDNSTGGSTAGMTVGSGATLLVATACWQTGAVTARAMTWDGVAMTEALTFQRVAGANSRVSLFTLVSPNVGNKTLAISWTTTSDCYVGCVSFTGTDTVTGYNAANNATSTTTTVTVTATSDGATVAVWTTNGSTPTMNFTKIWDDAPFDPGGGSTYQLGGSSNGHTFTGAGGSNETGAGINVIAASATTVRPRSLLTLGSGS